MSRTARTHRNLGLVAAGILSAAVPLTAVAQLAPAHAAPATRTRHVVVRPVKANGHAASGYSVYRERGSLDCGDQSPSSVSAGVDTCYPSAAYAPSCWKATMHTALCLRDADDNELVRMRYAGRFVTHHVLPAAKRMPQSLTLADGETCTIRVGGAWGEAPGHPRWVGFYSCTHGSLYGAPDSGGIDRSQPVWHVHELIGDDSIVTRHVTTATYVGTAG
ncbi:MAG: hypothetical protein FWE71_10950 [Nocardioidaceae bacterium]|nr:hypothetical protein [Nocardioidaceae bacterium]MCL2611868.1 hypothetical protein [Nocardioidaceae bacterium]